MRCAVGSRGGMQLDGDGERAVYLSTGRMNACMRLLWCWLVLAGLPAWLAVIPQAGPGWLSRANTASIHPSIHPSHRLHNARPCRTYSSHRRVEQLPRASSRVTPIPCITHIERHTSYVIATAPLRATWHLLQPSQTLCCAPDRMLAHTQLRAVEQRVCGCLDALYERPVVWRGGSSVTPKHARATPQGSYAVH